MTHKALAFLLAAAVGVAGTALAISALLALASLHAAPPPVGGDPWQQAQSVPPALPPETGEPARVVTAPHKAARALLEETPRAGPAGSLAPAAAGEPRRTPTQLTALPPPAGSPGPALPAPGGGRGPTASGEPGWSGPSSQPGLSAPYARPPEPAPPSEPADSAPAASAPAHRPAHAPPQARPRAATPPRQQERGQSRPPRNNQEAITSLGRSAP